MSLLITQITISHSDDRDNLPHSWDDAYLFTRSGHVTEHMCNRDSVRDKMNTRVDK
jgi:hypothetical protein